MSNACTMELWAAGFNALGQIQRPSKFKMAEDIWTLTLIAKGQHIQVLHAGWGQTVLLVDGTLQVLGTPLNGSLDLERYVALLRSTVRCCLDSSFQLASTTSSESEGLQAFTGTCLLEQKFYVIPSLKDVQNTGPPNANANQSTSLLQFSPAPIHGKCHLQSVLAIATTSRGTTAVIFCDPETGAPTSQGDRANGLKIVESWFEVVEFDSFSDTLDHLNRSLSSPSGNTSTFLNPLATEKVPRRYQIPGWPKCLLANALSFILLTEDGTVWTWAHESRYSHALGRNCNDAEHKVTAPGVIEELAGLKIVYIAASSWMAGAVSEGGEAWIWGCDAPGEQGGNQTAAHKKVFTTLKDHNEVGDFLVKVRLPISGEVNAVESKESAEGEVSEINWEAEIKSMAIGDGHILVLEATSIVWCFGNNDKGQLGICLSDSKSLRREERSRVMDHEIDNTVRSSQLFENSWIRMSTLDCQSSNGVIVRSILCGDFTSFVLLEKTVF